MGRADEIIVACIKFSRSQWPRGISHELSLPAQQHWDRGFESHLRH
jgi:hypothetical protein